MLTVKHIEPSGHETIWPAIRVAYQPKMGSNQKPAPPGCDGSGDIAPCVFIDRMGERGLVDTIPIGSFGSFFVMNEHGKTIARYDLGGWEVAGVPAVGGTWTATTGGTQTEPTITRVS